MKKYLLILWTGFLVLQSCASKKDVLYFQDIDQAPTEVIKTKTYIQVNDILKITVTAPIMEAALPYNVMQVGNMNNNTVEGQKLDGYLVNSDLTIVFPVLGKIDVSNKTVPQLESYIQKLLIDGGQLKDAVVRIRLLNAKVTVLGEVNKPGTYSFTEENITLPQALGIAGDLTIRGVRNDVLVLREVDGKRTVGHIDMTKTDWFNSPFYLMKQNDVVVVQPNNARVKNAGYIPDINTLVAAFAILLSTFVIITR